MQRDPTTSASRPVPDADDVAAPPGFLAGGGEMGARIRATDWSTTPLGPPESWPQSLKTCVRIILTSRQPMFVWWGEQLINLYNDAYKAIVGGKHPDALGQPASVVWREIWDQVGPRAESTIRRNEGTYDEALLLIMERYGYKEETYYTFSYSPVPSEGGTGGLICANTDDTRRIIGERQLLLLRDLAARTAEARMWQDACLASARALETNPQDLPFALIYMLDDDRRTLSLAGTAGIRRGHLAAPETLSADAPSPWPVAALLGATQGSQAAAASSSSSSSSQQQPPPPSSSTSSPPWSSQPSLPSPSPSQSSLPLPFPLLGSGFGALPTGAWDVPPERAIALPIAPSGATGRPGVLLLGLNPYRLYDDNYQGFLALVAGQISAGIANAQAYEDERKRAEALAELDRAKTTFFSNVSHELRTPLTLILGPLEDALGSPGLALTGQDLETAYRNALRLLRLVNALLDFARIEAGRVQATFAPVDLATRTRELAGVFRAAVERAGLRLEVRCQPLREPVHVDPEMWEKIVLNLVSNAFKFTFEGEIEVALDETDDGRAVALTVRDTGIGLAADELPRLFERFHRVEGARARTHEGSGIGLALVQELVRIHGGTIAVASELGKGTRFTITIPFGREHLPTARIGAAHVTAEAGGQDRVGDRLGDRAGNRAVFADEALRWLPDAPFPAAPPPTDRKAAPARILLADDNADMRGYLARLLRQHWEVHAVTNGAEALTAARREDFDLVLADVMMPELDGFGLLRELRASPATRAVPVIMLSARAGEESRVEGLQAGADDYLVKPFSARELLARVRTHLALARARVEAVSQWQRLISLFEQFPAAVAIIGKDLRYEFTNDAHRRQSGRDLRGVDLREGWRHDAEHVSLYERTLASAEPARLTASAAHVPGPHGAPERRYFDLAIEPWLDSSGDVQGLISLSVDVTDQVDARREREDLLGRERAARAEAVAANRAKDEFLAMLGHELRNPLAPIVTALQLLRLRSAQSGKGDGKGDADGKGGDNGGSGSKERQVIERQVQHLVRLVDDLLDVSRITRGKLELRKEPVELSDVVAKGIDLASPVLEQRRHHLEVDVARQGLLLDGDVTRLSQVVSNLITNAAKYSPPGGHIRVSAQRDGGTAVLRVRDQGIGISAEILPHVFELFVQERQALDRSQGGLGLGLSIVRNLVELHGGRVSAHSDGPGRGSEFTVELPIATERRATTKAATGAHAASDGTGAARQPGSVKVLVVDDNEDAAETLRDWLHAGGHEVTVVHDAVQALAVVEGLMPDVVLLDIGLPVMDGYELARRLRGIPALDDTRLIAVTGYGQSGEEASSSSSSSRSPFDARLVKPVDLDALARLLKAHRPAAP